MNQSTKIVGFIAAAFVVFVTVRGELPIYMGFMLGTAPTASTGGASTAVSPQAAEIGVNAAMAMVGAM